MKFKGKSFFIVFVCLFLCFTGLIYKASGAPGDMCTLDNICSGCHNADLLICGSQGEYLRQIDWSAEKHGANTSDVAVVLNIHKDTPVDLAPRLVLGGDLSCTDCHEEHGTFTPNEYLLKSNVNNIPVEMPISRFDNGFCSFPGTAGSKTMGWFCRTCHKDDAAISKNVQYKNQWKYAHHFSAGGSDYPYIRTHCYRCHTSGSGQPLSCECCHYHGSMTTDYGMSYPCYLDSYICRTPYDRRTY